MSESGFPGLTETLVGRAVRNPDAEAKAPGRHLVQICRALCEILDRAGVDWRDRSTERYPLGGECQSGLLRHVAKPARDIDAGKTAPLELTRDVERLPPPSRNGDE